MRSIKKIVSTITLIALVAVVFTSCKKDEHKQPDLEFKTTSGYTYSDAAVGMNATVQVGIIADKTEDELKTLNVSVAYDGGSTVTQDNFVLTGAEEEHYEKDYTITTRNQAGTERWVFTITDRDGNIASVEFTLTVS